MTTDPPSLPPRPIRRGEWVEVRCRACGWYLFELRARPGNEGRRRCPKCDRLEVRTIREAEAA